MDLDKFVEEASNKQETMVMLNNLFDKATPKKPIREYYHFICPICSVEVDKRCNYCPMCGQAIDWSEKR